MTVPTTSDPRRAYPASVGRLSGERTDWDAAHEGDLVDRLVTERYRALRAAIEAIGRVPRAPGGPDDGAPVGEVHSLLVVGVDLPVAMVGLRLATAFAQAGQETLLVDADLRAARERSLAPAAGAASGLADWLRAEDRDLPCPAYPTGSPHLALVPAGRPVEAGFDTVRDDRWSALLRGARAERDRVVVVAAPLAAVADALLLARHVDGALLAVAPGKTTSSAAVRARDALRAAGGRIVGVVLDDGR
ncbi:MAG: hypothetical protein AVDCRST_MAG49-1285 [uncultured Thermomicrobiales bacterium]|uniref:Uncharacterized protein n=1 Tax=uncultured Thermomicrobiales bacterium TaxID=1645740 RepID=A0A6J4UC00_9BACT|nr:MAG: hypothetical protein AVDCRST_MAG49-1285 [uncultured Thermomicrobiales bacterium]